MHVLHKHEWKSDKDLKKYICWMRNNKQWNILKCNAFENLESITIDFNKDNELKPMEIIILGLFFSMFRNSYRISGVNDHNLIFVDLFYFYLITFAIKQKSVQKCDIYIKIFINIFFVYYSTFGLVALNYNVNNSNSVASITIINKIN